jgi:hypothetical protein
MAKKHEVLGLARLLGLSVMTFFPVKKEAEAILSSSSSSGIYIYFSKLLIHMRLFSFLHCITKYRKNRIKIPFPHHLFYGFPGTSSNSALTRVQGGGSSSSSSSIGMFIYILYIYTHIYVVCLLSLPMPYWLVCVIHVENVFCDALIIIC